MDDAVGQRELAKPGAVAARALDAVTNINASATISPFANAALLAGDATQLVVTCVQGGKIGNGITVTVTGTGWTATGAGKLINGTDGWSR